MDYDSQITKLAAALGEILQTQHLRVSVAESCTAGGVAEAITRIPGSSGWFEVGFVTYSNRAKSRLLGVDEGILNREGAVSRAVVEQMVVGALVEAQADLAAAISGIAGPDGGTGDKPVGTIWFAWATDAGTVLSVKKQLVGDRQSVRQQSVLVALEGLVEMSSEKQSCIKP